MEPVGHNFTMCRFLSITRALPCQKQCCLFLCHVIHRSFCGRQDLGEMDTFQKCQKTNLQTEEKKQSRIKGQQVPWGAILQFLCLFSYLFRMWHMFLYAVNITCKQKYHMQREAPNNCTNIPHHRNKKGGKNLKEHISNLSQPCKMFGAKTSSNLAEAMHSF